jgi:hypothetical protein
MFDPSKILVIKRLHSVLNTDDYLAKIYYTPTNNPALVLPVQVVPPSYE